MCTLYNRINDLCKNRGVSASRMCLDLGLSKSTMSDMKSGRKKGVSAETALKIAEYFGITVDDLYGREPPQNIENPGIPKDTEVDPIRAELLNLIEDATAAERKDYLDILRVFVSRREKR